LTHEKNPKEDEDNDRKPGEEIGKPRISSRVLDIDIDFVFSQDADKLIELVRGNGLEFLPIGVFAFDLIASDGHVRDESSLDFVQKLTERNLIDGACGLEQTVKNDDDYSRCDPEEYVAVGCDLLFLFGHYDFLYEKLF